MSIIGQVLTFERIINLIKAKEDQGISFCVYANIDSDDLLLTSQCLIEQYPEITDDDEELYPESVIDSGRDLVFREELIQDVIENTIFQKPDASNQEILRAIKHYNNNDAFMTC